MRLLIENENTKCTNSLTAVLTVARPLINLRRLIVNVGVTRLKLRCIKFLGC